jgi:hypothetical protein
MEVQPPEGIFGRWRWDGVVVDLATWPKWVLSWPQKEGSLGTMVPTVDAGNDWFFIQDPTVVGVRPGVNRSSGSMSEFVYSGGSLGSGEFTFALMARPFEPGGQPYPLMFARDPVADVTVDLAYYGFSYLWFELGTDWAEHTVDLWERTVLMVATINSDTLEIWLDGEQVASAPRTDTRVFDFTEFVFQLFGSEVIVWDRYLDSADQAQLYDYYRCHYFEECPEDEEGDAVAIPRLRLTQRDDVLPSAKKPV